MVSPCVAPRPVAPTFLGALLVAWLVTPAVAAGPRWLAAGHRSSVDGVAFSPDGSLAATASIDSTVKLWRTSDGVVLRTLLHPSFYAFHSVEFTADGQTVIASGTGGAYAFRVADGALLREYCCMETGYGTALSPDGQTLAVAGSIFGLEADVCLYRTSDGAELDCFTGEDGKYMFAALFTPDGETLITAEGSPFTTAAGGVIRIWNAGTGALLQTIPAHSDRVTSLALAPGGLAFASGSKDRTIKLWSLPAGGAVRTFTGHSDWVTGVDFAPDGTTLASASADATVRIWATATGQQVRTLGGFADDVAAVQFAPDGATVLAVGGRSFASVADPSARVWNAADGALVRKLTQLGAGVEAIAFSPDSALLASGGARPVNAGLVEIRNVADGSTQLTVNEVTPVYELAWSPNGLWLATVGQDRVVRVRSAATGGLLRSLSGHTGLMRVLTFSADSQMLASAAYGEPIRLWNPNTGGLIRQLTASNSGAVAAAFSSDGAYLVGGQDFTVHQWRTSDGGIARSYATSSLVAAIAFAPTGGLFAVAESLGTIRFWDAANGAARGTISGAGRVGTMTFANGGEVLVTGTDSTDQTVRFWRVADGTLLGQIDEETGTGVVSVAISPDQRLCSWARRDNTVVMAGYPLGPAPADADADGDVDDADFLVLADCLAGPETAPAPAGPATSTSCLIVFDTDADADVDLVDFADFARRFGN